MCLRNYGSPTGLRSVPDDEPALCGTIGKAYDEPPRAERRNQGLRALNVFSYTS